MNAGVNSSSQAVQQIVKDAHTAIAALAKVWPESNMTIGMSGWMLGPSDRPYYFDQVLIYNSAFLEGLLFCTVFDTKDGRAHCAGLTKGGRNQ